MNMLAKLLDFDRQMHEQSLNARQLDLLSASSPDSGQITALVGLDEVGRGCLAGPVVAAAVQLPEISPGSKLHLSLAGLNDSKALRAGLREDLCLIIRQVSRFAIGQASVEEIDQINILQASLLAMKRARLGLDMVSPAILLIDGNKKIPGLSDRQLTIVKGDSRSASIAAASIIAKVYRDELMCKLAASHPQYGWHENKGYGCPAHILALKQHGPTPWHRRSFNYAGR